MKIYNFLADPLNVVVDATYYSISAASTSYERKTKVALSDRDMYIVRLLRDNGVRTMDVAKIMGISERSVTRLLSKTKEMAVIEYDADIVAEVDRLLAQKDEILNAESIGSSLHQSTQMLPSKENDPKYQLAVNLLAMNVKIKDIAKMLDVCEKTVQRWKAKAQGVIVAEDTAKVEADGNVECVYEEYCVE